MKEKYTFTCPNCGHKFIPTFWRWFLVPHIFSMRYFRCDNCGKFSLMKRKKKEMKKQYIVTEGRSFYSIVKLYHDGIIVAQEKKCEGPSLGEYLNQIENDGYELAYDDEDVEETKREYEYILAHQLVKAKKEKTDSL